MIIERINAFWKKVDQRGPDECWPWKGARTVGGYGQLWSGERYRGQARACLATHIALAIDRRSRPSRDHVAMHSCDNPLCVNPAHLAWGTSAENMADRMWKSRARRATGHEPDLVRGHRRANAKLTEELVRYIRSSPATSLVLADELGVTNQCISRIRLRQTWQHVD